MRNYKEGGIMNTLSFAGDIARLQRAITESHDLVVRRGIVFETLNLRTGEQVLELGCGGGYYTHEAAQFVGPTGRVCATRFRCASNSVTYSSSVVASACNAAISSRKARQ